MKVIRTVNRESGMVMIVCMILLLMLSLIGIASMMTSSTDMDISGNSQHSTSAFYIADAGVEKTFSILRDSSSWRDGFNNQPLSGGTYTVTLADSASDPYLGPNEKVTSVGEYSDTKSAIEVVVGPASYHPLYNYAIYAGNSQEYDPDADPQVWSAQLDIGGCGLSRDIITGDIFFNGNVDINCDGTVNGSVEAGGTVTGNTPSEGAFEDEAYLEPPDLISMQYDVNSDFFINDFASWDGSGRLPGADPRHIFVREYRSDLMDDPGFVFNNTNYFFGDPWESFNLDRVSVSASGNQSVYYVDGNLWIEPMGETSQLVNGPPGGTQITVVVRGNIYFSDNLYYQDDNLDGIAFVAMSDGESYTDQNGNNQYDAGEPILHDDGDGIYEGNMEGSGNVCFGDPNGGPLGHVSGFIYAENNFEDYVLDGPDGNPQSFGVTGLLSAGNQFNVNRDYGGSHAEMTIDYDSRLHNGTLNLPNLPHAPSFEGWVVLSWRQLY